MDDDRNCALLFEYLRSILYDPQTQPLDGTLWTNRFKSWEWGCSFWITR